MKAKSLVDDEPRDVAAKAMVALARGAVESNAAVAVGVGTNGPELQTAVIVFIDGGRTYGIEVRRKSYERDTPDFEAWEVIPCRIKGA